MLPKISFLARMSRAPELSFTQNGIAVCKIGLACSEKFKEKESTLFIDATAFKTTAEMISKIGKGERVFVSGKLKTDTWQDKTTGQNRSKITLLVESFEYVEKKQQAGQQQGYQQKQGTGQQVNSQGFQQQGFPPQQHGGFHQNGGFNG